MKENELAIKIAQNKQLYKEKQWLKLVHYEREGKKFKSRSDANTAFFFSPDGRTNPEAELTATIQGFLESSAKGDNNPACKFPARFKWIQKEIGREYLDFDFEQCTKLNKYRNQLSTKSVSLVFVSAMMRIPASMFGHSFIKLNREIENTSDLEDWTLSYVADVEAHTIIDYAIKGITGGFKGTIDFQEFDYRIRYYNYHENRSMWELKLRFTEEEIERLVDHLWEIRNGVFRYYFMSKNCAYYNSYFLEVAKPDLDILKKNDAFTYPTETFKRLVENKDVLEKAVYYPANFLNYENGYYMLSPQNKHLLSTWKANNYQIPQDNPSQMQVFLNTARYRGFVNGYDKTLTLKENNLEQINQAEKIMIENNIPLKSFAPPDYTNPTIGHRPFMMSLLYNSHINNYIDFELRPSYHDRYDSPLGYPLYSEITALKATLSYNIDSEEFIFKRFDFIKLLSITPITAEVFNFSMNVSSWIDLPDELSVGFQRAGNYAFNFDNGYGLSFRIPFIKNEFIFYMFGNYEINLSHAYSDDYRFSAYAEGGIYWYPVDLITVHLNMQFGYFIPYMEFRWNAEAAFNVLINSNLSILAIGNYDFINEEFSFKSGIRVFL